MTDGTGTTTYSYNPINEALGAGRLDSVNVPIAGTSSTATVAYNTTAGATGYDELGRVVSRTIDGANPVGTTFDALGRVTNVSNPLGAFIYTYVDETSRLDTNSSTEYFFRGHSTRFKTTMAKQTTLVRKSLISVEAAGGETSLHFRHFAFACVTTAQNSVLKQLAILLPFAE
jgi:YD repeat-containing protein